ncbi:MAG TPA: HAMP domain-containing sensor histidine kinase [Polyangiaceae bacterium]|nr:HAMP domain-containing sensor histidine kinase [Polyangiaceae bacterium]
MSEEHLSRECLRLLLDHVAHDLRGRSGVILGALTQIEVGGDAEQIRKLVAMARRSAQQVLLMADGLQRAGELHSGAAHWEIEPRDLRELVQHAVERASAVETRRGITLDVRLPDAECVVSLDGEWMALTVTDLVVRAIQAARTRVVVELEAGPANAVLTVSDDGRPLPESWPERFSATPREQALGRTLSLARDVARAHGARLTTGERRPDWPVGGCIRFDFSRSKSDNG